MSDKRLLDAVQKTGEWKVISAFKQSTFIYGTKGSGSAVVRVLKAWAARPRTNVANGGSGNAAAAKDTNVAGPIQKSGLDACGIGTLKPTKSWALFSAQANSTSGCCTRRQRCRPRQGIVKAPGSSTSTETSTEFPSADNFQRSITCI